MKLIKFKAALTTGVIAVGLLLGTSTANAAVVNIDGTGTNATGIEDLQVGVLFYNVEFVFDSARTLYGDLPGDFPFPEGRLPSVVDANAAVNAALNGVPSVVTVGPVTSSNYFIGFESEPVGPVVIHTDSSFASSGWTLDDPGSAFNYDADATYADFTLVSQVPVPAAVWLFGSGLLGLVGMARRKNA